VFRSEASGNIALPQWTHKPLKWRFMEALALSFVGSTLLLLLAEAAESFAASLRVS
jgi:hypothetical protein